MKGSILQNENIKKDKKKMQIAIYIPSHRRPRNQRTFDSIPKRFIKNTFIVVDKQDFKKYKKIYGTNVIECPEKGICKTRQWIIENSKKKYALMLDDDMNFHVRDKNLKLQKCSPKDFINMVRTLESWLEEGIIHVGISQRCGNNRIEEDYVEITRMNNAYAYNCKKMIELKKKYNISFDYLENKYNKQLVMEDFVVTLLLLQRGFKNCVTYKYAWNQAQSGADGGCSLYRTSQMQKESAILLAQEFPKYVRVVEKVSSKPWKGFDSKTRTDVVIQWKRIFNTMKRLDGGIRLWLKK